MVRRATRADEHCTLTDVTSGTMLLSVQGPDSRALLGRLSSADLSNEAFPYLSARSIDVGHAQVLALRVTYLGELGYELHVPTEYGAGVYDALMEAGAELGVRPVGLSAMAGLRLEKGYRDLGVDIDNTDNPLEAGLGFAVAFEKPGGFTGREALLALRDRASLPVTPGEPAGRRPGRGPVRQRAGPAGRFLDRLRPRRRLRAHAGRGRGAGHGRPRGRRDRGVAGLGPVRGLDAPGRPSPFGCRPPRCTTRLGAGSWPRRPREHLVPTRRVATVAWSSP